MPSFCFASVWQNPGLDDVIQEQLTQTVLQTSSFDLINTVHSVSYCFHLINVRFSVLFHSYYHAFTQRITQIKNILYIMYNDANVNKRAHKERRSNVTSFCLIIYVCVLVRAS